MTEASITIARWLRDGTLTHVFVDADDTLWHDAKYFRELRHSLVVACGGIAPDDVLAALEFQRQHTGRGEAAYADAVLRTARRLGADSEALTQLQDSTSRFLRHSVELLPEADAALTLLASFIVVLLTKGISAEQQAKLRRSGLASRFKDVVVLGSKTVETFRRVYADLNVRPSASLVIGNSIEHDIRPAIELGSRGVWLNHPDNFHGRNGSLPAGACEVQGWAELVDAIRWQEQR